MLGAKPVLICANHIHIIVLDLQCDVNDVLQYLYSFALIIIHYYNI